MWHTKMWHTYHGVGRIVAVVQVIRLVVHPIDLDRVCSADPQYSSRLLRYRRLTEIKNRLNNTLLLCF